MEKFEIVELIFKPLGALDSVSIEFQEEQYNCFMQKYTVWFKRFNKNLLNLIFDNKKSIDEYVNQNWLNEDEINCLIKSENEVNITAYQKIIDEQETLFNINLYMTECLEILFPKINIEKASGNNLKSFYINLRTKFLIAQYDFLINLYNIRQSFMHEKIYFNAMNYFLRERCFLKTDVLSFDKLNKTILDRFAYEPDPFIQEIADKYKVIFED